MKTFSKISLLLLLLSANNWSTADAKPLTLKECYHKSLERSETLAIRTEDINTAEAHFLQALGTALPHLQVKASETIQDVPPDSGAPDSGNNFASSFTRRSRPEVAINLHQTLFQGFREFKSMGLARAEKRKFINTRDRAAELLFADVARSYYMTLELERESAILNSIRSTLLQRQKEIRERISLGKSRENEILTIQSQLSSLEATTQKTKGLLESSREMLVFLVGDEARKAPLVDEFKVPQALGSVDRYLNAIQERSDILALHNDLELFKGKLTYEKSKRLPTLDFDANYYPYRVGYLSDIQWDVFFSLNFPIFNGGLTRGHIKEAKTQLQQSQLLQLEATRGAERDIRQAYATVSASLKSTSSLERSANISGENYKAQVKDYQLGLVNNLEVLQSLRDWQEMRVQANRSFFQTKLDFLNLKIAQGGFLDQLK